jgi:cytochrome P450
MTYKTSDQLHQGPKSYGSDAFGSPPGLICADDVNHACQQKLVSHAFSDKALKEQETMLKGHVELLIRRLVEIADTKIAVDIVSWYNFTTSDVIALNFEMRSGRQ